MADGRARDTDEDAALEAVWGREASATAPPAPRPDIEALLAPEPDAGGPRRRRPLVLAVVLLVAGALVLLLGDGDPSDPTPEAGATTTEPGPAPEELPAEPAWALDVACLPVLDGGAAGTSPACPVATDDERTYVLIDAGGVPTVRALDVADGGVIWEQTVPTGAWRVERLPSVVVVTTSGSDAPLDGGVAVLDPVTGAELWQAPGTLAGALDRDHLLLDHEVGDLDRTVTSTMSVVEAATGRTVLERTGPSESMYVHPCGDAGLVLASEGEQLTAVGFADGTERWSVPAPHLDLWNPLGCDDRHVAFVDRGALRLLDLVTGTDVGTTTVAPAGSEDGAEVRALVSGTVVVGSEDGARGFRADADLGQLWRLRCRMCGPDLPAGAAGEDVVVLIAGEAVVRSGADGGSGPRLDLAGRTEKVLADGTLAAWGVRGLVVAATDDLGRPVHIDDTDVRQVAAGSSHVVVTTRDEVRAYPREG